MSGIAGAYYLDGRPVDDSALRRMVDILAHRGPDGAAIWHQGSVGLGHRMLHTTPESLHETLPRADPAGDLVLTADARIDNRDELMALLRLPKPAGRPITDGELILAAYEKWGVTCPEKLLGDFAFVIWDGREQRLFCARDHFGVKPFYYHFQPGYGVVFGSEIKALFCLDEVPCVLDELSIAYYLAKENFDEGETFYQDILCLPPAHSMIIRRDGTLRRQRYWSLDPDRELSLGSDSAYVEGFLEIFTEAVRCRLRTNTTPGVLMSGGLDSTSVACVARNIRKAEGQSPLHSFSAVFPNLPEDVLRRIDERRYVEAIANAGGIEVHTIPVDEISPLVNLERVHWHLDAPCFTSNMYLIQAMYDAARSQGVRVVLDGVEGDVVVSHGFAYLGELAYTGQWEQFAEEVLALTERAGASAQDWFRRSGTSYLAIHAHHGQWRAFLQGMRAVAGSFNLPYAYLLWQSGLKPCIPQPVRRAWRAMRGRGQADIPSIMARSLAERTDFVERMRAREDEEGPSTYTEREAHWRSLDANAGTLASVLAEVNHIASMFGVEQRHPFYDPRLVAYCVALPPEQKIKQGWTRLILRRAMEGILPEAVRWRADKADLSPNFYRNLFRMEQEQLDRLVDLEELAPYVNLETLLTAREREKGYVLWLVLVLSRWLNQARSVKSGGVLTLTGDNDIFRSQPMSVF